MSPSNVRWQQQSCLVHYMAALLLYYSPWPLDWQLGFCDMRDTQIWTARNELPTSLTERWMSFPYSLPQKKVKVQKQVKTEGVFRNTGFV